MKMHIRHSEYCNWKHPVSDWSWTRWYHFEFTVTAKLSDWYQKTESIVCFFSFNACLNHIHVLNLYRSPLIMDQKSWSTLNQKIMIQMKSIHVQMKKHNHQSKRKKCKILWWIYSICFGFICAGEQKPLCYKTLSNESVKLAKFY
jgi:hypothetical protein